uniref:PLOD1-3-like GT domain-containing protein n=1 Tax=viral metagenome TaxID=1070528 RepID=A0A6C0L862_9ZZZZ
MLHVITFATDEAMLTHIKESTKLSTLHIHYSIKSTWNGYFDKIIYTRKFLEGVGDDDIVCFVDAYDVLSLASAEEILTKFKWYECDLLLGAELNSYPQRYKEYYPPKEYTTNSIYINSGGYIGYKHAIQKLLYWHDDETIERMCSNLNGGDQAYFIEYYLRNPSDRIKLDTWQKIFQNMHWVSWNQLYIHRGRVVNVMLDEKPCFIHFNGGTWQTNDGENILPVFVYKLQASASDTDIYTLHEYKQLRTATCWPHKQIH